jgi:hypothetical protein
MKRNLPMNFLKMQSSLVFNLIILNCIPPVSSVLSIHKVCRLSFWNREYEQSHANTTKLFSRLKMAKADGSFIREIAKIERQDLLILDDFGLQPLDGYSRSVLMEIIEDRHGNRSTIITSQLPVSQWYEVIGEQTVADAILDRIVHDAHRIDLLGESLRKTQKNKITEDVETE